MAAAVLGQVRTVPTEFVAELRAAVGEGEELPSPGQNKIADARGNLVIGSSNVVQNNTNGFDARALLDFAGLVGRLGLG